MGSFAATCSVSGLPITRDTPVRFFLLTESPDCKDIAEAHSIYGLWGVRTFPLRALYNNYGTVEKVEEGAAQDIWMEALAKDLHPLPLGENPYHDLETSRSMSFETLLETLRERRVFCEQVSIGQRDRECKEAVNHARSLLGEELLPVPPKPPMEPPLKVQPAMVREDVWQMLLTLPTGGVEGTIQQYRDEIRALYLAYQSLIEETITERLEKLSIPPEAVPGAWVGVKGRRESVASWVVQPTMWETLRDKHWEMYLAKKIPVEEATAFIDSVAEAAYVDRVLMGVRFVWQPFHTAGDQFGDFYKHTRFLQGLADVAHVLALKELEEEAPEEDSDE